MVSDVCAMLRVGLGISHADRLMCVCVCVCLCVREAAIVSAREERAHVQPKLPRPAAATSAPCWVDRLQAVPSASWFLLFPVLSGAAVSFDTAG